MTWTQESLNLGNWNRLKKYYQKKRQAHKKHWRLEKLPSILHTFCSICDGVQRILDCNEGTELNKRPWFLLSPCRLYLETHHELLREHHLWNPQLDYVYPQHSTSPRPHSGHPQRVSWSLCRWAQRQSALLFKTGRRSITMNTLGSCSMENKWKFLSTQTGFVDWKKQYNPKTFPTKKEHEGWSRCTHRKGLREP